MSQKGESVCANFMLPRFQYVKIKYSISWLRIVLSVVILSVQIYRKKGKHRLSEEHDLKLISKTLDDLIGQLRDRVWYTSIVFAE